MKKLFAFYILLIGALNLNAQEKDPVILTINGKEIHKSEFMYMHAKNNNNPSFQKDSLDAYMELFINYKLKVFEAEKLGYDTIPSIQKELAGYREQATLPYMTDKAKNEELIKEAYDRTINEVRASHILIRVAPDASPEDTLLAYQKAMDLRKRIVDGENFESVAKGPGGSEDPSVKNNGGDLGYFTALQMVYPFEDAAYKTPVGEVSMPVRTRFGYHIIKVVDKRESKGKIKTAHIMIMVPQNENKESAVKAKEKIDEIYALLEQGESFEDLAMRYSDDQSSKNKGGVLPVFGAGTRQRMVPEFEEAAFSLKNDGDYTAPIRTPYGWHIIKRIELEPMPSYEAMHRELKLKVERDMRAEKSKESFINSLKKEYNYRDEYGKYQVYLEANVTDEIFNAAWKGFKDDSNNKNFLFGFADQSYTVGDFQNYLIQNQKRMPKKPIYAFLHESFANYVNESISVYEESKLEEKHQDFKFLMQEYRDGILIFEIMRNQIWDKASKDSAGIRNYYENHKSDFTFPLRYKGDLYQCIDKETAEKVYNMLASDTLDPVQIRMQVNDKSQLNLQVKSHTFSSENTDALKKGKKGKKARKFKEGLNKIWERNGNYYVFKVAEVLPARPREFAEAKGLVTAAYQSQLEEEWLKKLREEYTIVINNDVLYNLNNSK